MNKILSSLNIASTKDSEQVRMTTRIHGKLNDMSRVLATVKFIVPILLLLWVSHATAAIQIEVTMGKETVLTLKNPSQRISLASPDVADVLLISPVEIVINGKKPGTTSLIVWDKEGNKNFYDIIVTPDMRELDQRIKEIAPNEDIHAEYVRDTIVLRGYVSNQNIIDNVVKVAAIYAEKGDPVTTRSYSAGVTDERIVTTYKVVNYLRVGEAQQVILEVRVAQIDKNKIKDLGISALTKQRTWELTAPGLFTTPSGTVGGQSGVTSAVGSAVSQGTSGTVSPGIGGFDVGALAPQIGAAYFPGGVAAVLRALQNNGYGKILAEPNLTVRSGETGRFFAGTSVPVQEITGVGASATAGITFVDVGIILNFKPEVLETGVIRLRIDPARVSNILNFITFSGGIVAPEIDSREVSTSVDLREGESLVLAGLLSEQTKKNIQKMPIFGDIPILGAIFRNTHDELEKTELAFFITPRLAKPIPVGVKTVLPEERHMSPQEEKEFEWIPLPSSSPEQFPKEGSTASLASAAPKNGNLEEEINLFMGQYRSAYESGDVDSFMSLYSKSAVENGMNYDVIRGSYQKSFAAGRYTYTLRNPQIQKSDDPIVLTGTYSVKKIGEMQDVHGGFIRWTLVREGGTLKIVKAEYASPLLR